MIDKSKLSDEIRQKGCIMYKYAFEDDPSVAQNRISRLASENFRSFTYLHAIFYPFVRAGEKCFKTLSKYLSEQPTIYNLSILKMLKVKSHST